MISVQISNITKTQKLDLNKNRSQSQKIPNILLSLIKSPPPHPSSLAYIIIMALYSTINSFTQPPSAAQIIAYLIFLMQILIFSIIIQARLSCYTARVVLIVLYVVSIVAQAVSTFVTSVIDPSDSLMVCSRNSPSLLPKTTNYSQLAYCQLCQSHVKQTTKHCRPCNRCVQEFDHHCMWINNCVGSKNYRPFFTMLVTTLTAMLIFLISCGMLWGEARFEQKQGGGGFLGEMVVVWVGGAVVVIFWVLVLNLMILHLYLCWNGITTFQLLTEGRNKKQGEQLKDQQMTIQGLEQKNQNSRNSSGTKRRYHKKQKAHEKQENNPSKLGSNQHLINTGSLRNLGATISSIETKAIVETEQLNLQAKGQPKYKSKVYIEMEEGKGNERNEGKKKKKGGENLEQNQSDRESVLSQFFSRNRSLDLMVSHDIVGPQNLPKTTKNTSDIRKPSQLKQKIDQIP